MAIEQERMVVVIEARLDKLEKGFAKARGDAAKTFAGITTDATKMETALARVGSGGFDRLNRSAGALRAQTANVSAQFQDIAVQLGGGTSPFLIALQQGTQLTAALGSGGLRATVSALGAGFMSLLSPLSLVTIAVIALGGTAVQKLTEWLATGEMTAEQLKEHISLVQQVAQRWGEAVPELQAYLAELNKIKEINDAIKATDQFKEQQWEPVRQQVSAVNAEMVAFLQNLMDAGNLDALGVLTTEWERLRDEVARGRNASDEAQKVLDILNGTMLSGVRGADILAASVASLIKPLNDVAVAAGAADASVQRLLATQMLRSPLGTLTPLTSNGGQFMNPAQQQEWAANNTKSQTQLAAEKAARSGRSSAISQAEREREAVKKLIETLEFERSLIGLSAVEREKANALRRAGTAATEAEKSRIAELTEQIYLQEAAHEAAEDAIERQKRAMEELGQIGMDALQGLVDAFADGKIEGRELGQIISNIIQQLLNMPTSGGGIGGLLSALLGGGFGSSAIPSGLAGPWGASIIPKYAAGTKNHPGGFAWVGENGKELVNLPRGAEVIPHSASMAAGGISAPITFAPVIQASGNAAADDRMLKELRRMFDREFTPRTVKALKDIKMLGKV